MEPHAGDRRFRRRSSGGTRFRRRRPRVPAREAPQDRSHGRHDQPRLRGESAIRPRPMPGSRPRGRSHVRIRDPAASPLRGWIGNRSRIKGRFAGPRSPLSSCGIVRPDAGIARPISPCWRRSRRGSARPAGWTSQPMPTISAPSRMASTTSSTVTRSSRPSGALQQCINRHPRQERSFRRVTAVLPAPSLSMPGNTPLVVFRPQQRCSNRH